jgi:surfeit locus 1 family protein
MITLSHFHRFLIVLIAAVVVVAGTFSLGQWQLRRAAQKEALQLRIQTMNQLAVLDSPALLQMPDPAQARDRAVLLSGRWIAAKTVYLDNRPMGDKTGFWVYTPLVLAGSDQAVLVQRGWVPRNFMDRTRLPSVETPADTATVTVAGRIAPPPSKLYSFDEADQGQIRQNLDMVSFRQEIGLPLLSVSVVQLGLASEGLQRDWPAPNLGVDKHYGYAFQWFALCGLTAGLYGWFQVLGPWRRRRADRSNPGGEPASQEHALNNKPDRH